MIHPPHLLITLALILVLSMSTHAQIVPQQNPTDTSVGGSGASNKTLERLKLPADERKTLNNIEGPSKGWGRSRHDVQIYKVTNDDLPNVENYYLRSSTVILERGGVSPVHSHFERPAFLQVLSGSVFQHRSDGASFYMGPEDFTFSSHELAHWWINESTDETMRLWIVELCTTAHKCEGIVDGGAVTLKGTKKTAVSNANSTLIHEIDLDNEFKNAAGIGNRKLRLRKITIKPGESLSDQNSGRVAFLRVAEGTIKANGEEINSGVFLHAPNNLSNHIFTNISDKTAILYSVDITNP